MAKVIAERNRLREALQDAARSLEHIGEALRIDGRLVGAYTKNDARAHCEQLANAARAALDWQK